MSEIEDLLRRFRPHEASRAYLARGLALIDAEGARSVAADRWRLATAVLTVLLLASAALNGVLWMRTDQPAAVPGDRYIASNVLRMEDGRPVREVRFEEYLNSGERHEH